jgi:hypothetical protein
MRKGYSRGVVNDKTRSGAAGASRRRHQPPSIVVRLPSGPPAVAVAQDLATRTAQLAGFDDETSGSVGRDVAEATSRLVEDPGAPKGASELEVRLEDRGVQLEVEVRRPGGHPSSTDRVFRLVKRKS